MTDNDLLRAYLAQPPARRRGCLDTLGNIAFLVVIVGLFLLVAVKVVPDLLVSYGLVSAERMTTILHLATPAPTFTVDGTPLAPVAPVVVRPAAPTIQVQPAAPVEVAPVAQPAAPAVEAAPTPWPIDTAATEQVQQQTANMAATAAAQSRIDAWLRGPPSTPTPTTVEDWKASFADQPDCARVLVGWIGAKRTECAATATAAAKGGE